MNKETQEKVIALLFSVTVEIEKICADLVEKKKMLHMRNTFDSEEDGEIQRALSLAITKLDEAQLWITKAISA